MIAYNYIAIEGNIGAGKTSLARKISSEFNAKLILERFEENDFLPKFYKEPAKYAFPLELAFLADRFKQLKEDLKSGDIFKNFIVSDYFIDKSIIFARNTLEKDEYRLYSRLFEIISATLPKPDLLVYLYRSTDELIRNISKRGRSYEKSIEISYLDKINKGYVEHFKYMQNQRILVIDTQGIDFIESEDNYRKIISLLEQDYPVGVFTINSL